MTTPLTTSIPAPASPLPVRDSLPQRITLLCLAALTVMAGATVVPSLPALQDHFADSNHSELLSKMVLTLPALSIALGAPLAGVAADRWGRLPLLLGALLLYALAGTSGLIADSLPALLAGRALLGLAAAGTMTAVTALAGDYYRGTQRKNFMGSKAAFVSFGGVVFLLIGGLLADWHWRAPFAVYALALLLLPAVLRNLRELPRFTDTAAATAEQAPAHNRPLLAAVLGAALLASLAFFLIPTQMPFLLRELGITQPSRAGLAIGCGNLAAAVSALLLYRRLRLRNSGLVAASFAVMGTGLLLVTSAEGYGVLILALVLFGLGKGVLMPHLAARALELAPAALRGRVAGALTASLFLGQFLSPLASQPLVAHFGLTAGFAVMGTVLLLVAAATAAAICWPDYKMNAYSVMMK
ncbi:MFS transporter [Microbulbifer sp. SAOS-129_SWC]|uniref:MFS transporter n=1 Tax=Microbulbifer sp. SAOS-129_SWC TaxID=3145235 RepID=UPI003216E5D7